MAPLVNSSISLATAASSGNHTSTTLTAVLSAVTPLLALLYSCALYLVYRYGKKHPKPLNKTSGRRLQQYAPGVYALMVFSSLAEIAVASWLLLQFRLNDNSPNSSLRIGSRMLLFSACWTALTAGAYTFLFMHPIWSQHAISSIGAQATWVIVTWIFWIVGAAVLNGSQPHLFTEATCAELVYCGQIQTLVALGVVQILALTLGMLTIMWLAWQSTRSIIRTPQRPLTITSIATTV
ncbi:hypothetical protein PLICRDRAFT_39865 [Plicaturopsis crispa FD-325 SS-3]|nr:hypothetical protein PLICRDRAFT_39865 [Plicaturopsis crispa FD-325 SS-3]